MLETTAVSESGTNSSHSMLSHAEFCVATPAASAADKGSGGDAQVSWRDEAALQAAADVPGEPPRHTSHAGQRQPQGGMPQLGARAQGRGRQPMVDGGDHEPQAGGACVCIDPYIQVTVPAACATMSTGPSRRVVREQQGLVR